MHMFADFMALGLALEHFWLQGWILGQNTLRKSSHFGNFLAICFNDFWKHFSNPFFLRFGVNFQVDFWSFLGPCWHIVLTCF